MIIFALSLPVLGGHNQVGGRWCECDTVQGVCPCCGGLLGVTSNQENESTSQHVSDDEQPMLEIGIIRMAFLMWLKVKA
jgi:hypothetical protein